MATAAEIRKAMEQNSAAWQTADAATRAKLANDNQNLGASIGATYNPEGTWDYSNVTGFENPTQMNPLKIAAMGGKTGPGITAGVEFQNVQQAPKTAMSSSMQTAAMPVTQQGYQSSYKGPDINQWKNSLNSAIDLKRAAGLTSLKNQRDVALQGLNSSETQAKNSAYNQKNQVAGNSALAAKRLSEILAAQGIRGGDNLSANARLQSAAQGSLSQIGQNESAILQDIMEKRGLTNNQASSQEAALIQESEADRLNRLLDLEKYGDQSAMNWDQISYGRYADDLNRTFQQQQAGVQNKMAEAGLTGSYGGQDTLAKLQLTAQQAAQKLAEERAAKQDNWNAYGDMVNWTGNLGQGPTSTWGDLVGRSQTGNPTLDSIYKANDAAFRQNEADRNYNQTSESNGLARMRLANDEAQTSWSRDPKNPDNIYKNAQIEALQNKGGQQSQEKMNSELQGLSSAIRGGKLSADQAYQQIEEDIKMGFYTQDEATQLRNAVRTLTGKTPSISKSENPFAMPYQGLLYKK